MKTMTPLQKKSLYACYRLVILLLAFSGYELFAQCTVLIDQDFNHWNDRRYTVADAKSDFNNKIKPWTASTYRGIAAPGAASNLIGDVKQETRIVNGQLRAEYTKNDAGGYAGGFLFDPYFDGVEEAYLEYKVKFDDNFFWATGGKLPGLGGSTTGINSETTGRGTVPSGCKYNTNGWSARLMWRRNRAQTTTPYLILYSYFAEKDGGGMRQDGDCGDAKRIFTGLNDNTWYTIRQYIKMNTPGQKDGTVIMWINGVETYKDTKALIRNSGKGNLKINALIMNTYRGGSRTDPVWHSPRDEYAFFDDFKVWTGCSDIGNNTNNPPTGSFLEPTLSSVQEGYSELYVNVDASDPDGDDVNVLLKIDGTDVRTESNAPYEWGHANTPNPNETLNLTPGDHILEAVITDSRGASHIIQKTITVVEPKGPYGGVPIGVPGIIQAEDYDKGGPDVSYSDGSNGNAGNEYRNDDVDIDVGGTGYAIGWTASNEWLEYTVDVANTAAYDFEFHVSSLNGGGMLNVYVDGDMLLSQVEIPQTGDWDTYSSMMKLADLDEGEHVIRIAIESSGFNLDRVVISPSNVTSNQNLIGRAFSVYPNPSASGQFHVEPASEWRVVNAMGMEIGSGSGELIDLSSQEQGVYFLRINEETITIVK